MSPPSCRRPRCRRRRAWSSSAAGSSARPSPTTWRAAGERDVVLVERGRLTNGTTWHAAGLVSQVRGSHALTALSAVNAETYERVGRESGIDTGLRRAAR